MENVKFVCLCWALGNKTTQYPSFNTYNEALELGQIKLMSEYYEYFTVEKRYYK